MSDLSMLDIANLGGTVFVVSTFLIYLTKKDTLNKETFDKFNNTINNHLVSSINAQSKLAKNLQGLTSAIKSLNNKVKK